MSGEKDLDQLKREAAEKAKAAALAKRQAKAAAEAGGQKPTESAQKQVEKPAEPKAAEAPATPVAPSGDADDLAKKKAAAAAKAKAAALAKKKREGIADERIHFVGNVMIDTLQRCRAVAEKSGILETAGVESGKYAVLTIHRPGNVDEPAVFDEIVGALEELTNRIQVVFPVHPRTGKRIEESGFTTRFSAMTDLLMIPPVGYLEFLALQSQARLVLTDSGGVQEETTVLDVPCLTLRPNTERPVTVTQGTNEVVGHSRQRIVDAANRILDGHRPRGRVPEFWDGHAGERISEVLMESMS